MACTAEGLNVYTNLVLDFTFTRIESPLHTHLWFVNYSTLEESYDVNNLKVLDIY